MVLQIHHDRYGHKYYTYPEYSKLYHDYCPRGPQLFYEPNRTRWYYHCYWPQEALNFATAEDKRRRMIVSREKINFNYFPGVCGGKSPHFMCRTRSGLFMLPETANDGSIFPAPL